MVLSDFLWRFLTTFEKLLFPLLLVVVGLVDNEDKLSVIEELFYILLISIIIIYIYTETDNFCVNEKYNFDGL